MPESVTDRPTTAHEYIFLLTKSERYFYDADAIAEPSIHASEIHTTRNKRSVWTIATQPFPEAHFATFPEEIPRTCILAGSMVGDVILDPFSGSARTGVAALSLGREYIGIERSAEYVRMSEKYLKRVVAWQPNIEFS